MSLRIHVEAYSGYKANERPLSFSLDIAIGENGVTNVRDIAEVEEGDAGKRALALRGRGGFSHRGLRSVCGPLS